MRSVLWATYRLLACTLALTPAVLMLGAWITGDWRRPAQWVIGVSLLALAAAWLPGKRAAGGRMVSWRLLAALMLSALIIGALCCVPWLYTGEVGLFARIGSALMMAALFLTQLRACTAQESIFERPAGLGVGVGLYLLAGAVVWAQNLWELNAALYGCAGAFLVVCAFGFNAESLSVGYAAHRKRSPAAGVLWANRLMLLLLIGIVALVAMFERIRAWASDTVLASVRAIGRLLMWLGSLLAFAQTDSGGMGSGAMDFLPAEAGGEPHIVWRILYYAVLAIALGAAAWLLFLAARALARKLRALVRRIIAYFRGFARAISEDYTDERTSLLDARELRKSLQGSMRGALRRLARREKRWEQLSARERVRFVVRSLYRKAGDLKEKLRPMSIREAVGYLRVSGADPGALADAYDRARYSEHPVSEEEAQALRQAGVGSGPLPPSWQ